MLHPKITQADIGVAYFCETEKTEILLLYSLTIKYKNSEAFFFFGTQTKKDNHN